MFNCGHFGKAICSKAKLSQMKVWFYQHQIFVLVLSNELINVELTP